MFKQFKVVQVQWCKNSVFIELHYCLYLGVTRYFMESLFQNKVSVNKIKEFEKFLIEKLKFFNKNFEDYNSKSQKLTEFIFQKKEFQFQE